MSLLFSASLVAQMWNLGRTFLPALDEGVYLCAARQMTAGAVPYRDFFLSHPPYSMLGAAAGLAVTRGDVPAFNALYTIWVFSAVFAVYFVTLRVSGQLIPAILGAFLFVTFPEFALRDARFFSLRQASLPFLAFGILLLLLKERQVAAGILFGLFAGCVASNVAVAACVLLAVLASDVLGGRSAREAWRAWRPACVAFGVTTLVLYLPLFLIPNGYADLLAFQANRRASPWGPRLSGFFTQTLPANAPILLAGLFGCVSRDRRLRAVALSNLLALPILLLASRSYYPHYLAILAVGLALSAGAFIAFLPAGRWRIAGSTLIVAAVSATAGPKLWEELIRHRTPELFSVVRALRETPEPLFSFEPIYSLYSHRQLTPHAHVCDMRYFRVQRMDPGDALFLDVLERSRTVLVEPSMRPFLTARRREALRRDFDPVYRDPDHVVLVRKSSSPRESPVTK
ncbi:MAG TPA: hypothetical protein VLJ18_09895 [Thermoanaerobaculia bacterium]|nr:hypothetical protein [Thermoanaerobaculia bacterium]